MSSITTHPKKCPFPLRCIFNNLFKKASSKFPNEPRAGYLAVNSFLFLRFFVVAILNPDSFGLVFDNISSKNRRTLMLLAKIIQKMASFGDFNDSKEPFMLKLNYIVPHYHANLTNFVNELVCVQWETPSIDKTKPIQKTPSIESIREGKKPIKLSKFSCFFCFGGSKKVNKEDSFSDFNLNPFKEVEPKEIQKIKEPDFIDLSTIKQDIQQTYIDTSLHLAAIARQLLKQAENFILNCQTDQETKVIYSLLSHISPVSQVQEKYEQARNKLLEKTQEAYRHKLIVADIANYESDESDEESKEASSAENILEKEEIPNPRQRIGISVLATNSTTFQELAKIALSKVKVNSDSQPNSRSSSVTNANNNQNSKEELHSLTAEQPASEEQSKDCKIIETIMEESVENERVSSQASFKGLKELIDKELLIAKSLENDVTEKLPSMELPVITEINSQPTIESSSHSIVRDIIVEDIIVEKETKMELNCENLLLDTSSKDSFPIMIVASSARQSTTDESTLPPRNPSLNPLLSVSETSPAMEFNSSTELCSDSNSAHDLLHIPVHSPVRRRTVNFSSLLLPSNASVHSSIHSNKNNNESDDVDNETSEEEDPIFNYLYMIGKKRQESVIHGNYILKPPPPTITHKAKINSSKVLQNEDIESFIIEKTKPKKY
jgi:hypothetical protein